MAKILKNMFSLEGIDGSGKTTQIPLVREYLERVGFLVRIFKNPSTSVLGEFIRKNVRSFNPWLRNKLFILDIQAMLMDQGENPDPNIVLLWDRYIDSFYTSNPEMTIEEANKLVFEMPTPIKTFWLDIKPAIVLKNRSETTNEHSDPKWLSLKQQRYNELLRKNPKRIVRINGQQPIESVTKQIAEEIIKTMRI
jgi:dTMP kinase